MRVTAILYETNRHTARVLIRCLAAIFFSTALWGQGASVPFETNSLLNRPLYALPDDGSIAAAQQKVALDPHSAQLALALSKAQAARRQYKEAVATCTAALNFSSDNPALLLERGHRELGLRDFPAAQADLQRAALLDSKQLDNFYHLGLAYYFQRQFADAAASFRKALDLAKTADSVIDCSNWLYVSLRRAGDKQAATQILERITPDVHNTEPHLLFYLKLLHFYQRTESQHDIFPAKPASPDDLEAELSFNTVSYGVGNWDLYNGQAQKARELFEAVVTGQAWNSWGFIGSELELARPEISRGPARPILTYVCIRVNDKRDHLDPSFLWRP